MSKFLQILLIAACAIALSQAEAPRYRSARFNAARRNGFSARQEIEAPAAVTPYPSAAELKPEVPFEEVENNAAVSPAIADVPNQPDQTYGPPEIETDEEVSDAELEQQQPETEEDEPAAEEEQQPAEAEPAEEEEAQEEGEQFAPEPITEAPQSERLVFGRRIAGRRAARPAKLRAAPRVARLQQQQQQQQFMAQPLFVYQQW